MAAGTDLAVDLQAALQGAPVELAEDAGERPVALGQLLALGRQRGARLEAEEQGGGNADRELPHGAFSIGLADAPALAAPPTLSTGSPIETGSGSGRSSAGSESSGVRTRKWKKYQNVATWPM